MILKTFFVRFYKSFNIDYLRKFHPKAEFQPWDKIDELNFPFVRVPIEPTVTAVVGANESGKSHLLSAIKKGLTGEEIDNVDTCRYSQFYSVEKGKRKLPDFGFEFTELDKNVKDFLVSITTQKRQSFSSFFFFRIQKQVCIYLPTSKKNEFELIELEDEQVEKIQEFLPHPFEIESKVGLPNSVFIKSLFDDEVNASVSDRKSRIEFLDKIQEFTNSKFALFQDASTVTQNAQAIVSEFADLRRSSNNGGQAENKTEIGLATDLICKIAKVDPKALQELHEAIKDGNDGHVAGLVQDINRQLEISLNFPSWWVQDKSFQLKVNEREVDLVFTIRDRTNTEYSFSERSSGLKYFLSYYVQYLAHEPHKSKNEILLMDEPDAYLSSQAQQDLLKIFNSFAEPKTDKIKPIQVVFVTHSPFLIDKNHAERIRVLEKGISDEGTRIVNDAGKNHYEPLRSAFGSFVGETAFIGSTNLFVEGISDQILLAGASLHLRKKSTLQEEVLDLNNLTIVPAGSASHIPYLVYLARGRDVEKPATIVLLDSDDSGNKAKEKLKRDEVNKKQILREDLILQLGELATESGLTLPTNELNDIEDLVPLPLCVEAIKGYLKTFSKAPNDIVNKIDEALIQSKIATGKALIKSIKETVEGLGDFHIEKVGFARSLMDVVKELEKNAKPVQKTALEQFETNMKILFSRLNKIKRIAERELTKERVSMKIKRLKNEFVQDNRSSAPREQAFLLFERIEASLDNSDESDSVRASLLKIEREFNIATEKQLPIDNYEKFKEALEQISYAGKLDTQVA